MRWRIVAGSVLAAGVAVAGENPVVVSQAGQGRTLSLTVYNVGRALVRDARPVSLPGGTLALEFRDIAAHVMPETVAIGGEGVTVLEQNYEYDLLSPQTLLAKYLGKDVTMVIEERQAPGAVVRKEDRACFDRGRHGLADGDGIVSNPHRELNSPRSPRTCASAHPGVASSRERAGERRLRRHPTGGVTWKADYVSPLARAATGKPAGVGDARQHLGSLIPGRDAAAGGRDAPRPERRARRAMMMAAMMAAEMREEAFAEYHLYTLERPTTIRIGRKAGGAARGRPRQGGPAPHRESPRWWRAADRQAEAGRPVEVELANRADNHLGMALPGGVVRLYQRDRRGTAQFVGEDRIEHTPKDELVKVTMGNAFDIVAERRQTDYRKLADNLFEDAFEVTLRNHKDSAITVEVREALGGDWEMSQLAPYEKARSPHWLCALANGETKSPTVRVCT
jgi:hypothetical protein